MGKHGPVARSEAAYRCGPHGLARKQVQQASKSAPPLPIKPPSWLRVDAAAVWTERRADVAGRATRGDLDLFANYCIACAEVRRLSLAVVDDPGLAEDLRAAQRVQLACAKALGLTPESRARLPKTEDEESPDAASATVAGQLR